MKKTWSFYNTLFRTSGSGFFLYNALSNVMFELDEKHYRWLEKIRDDKVLLNENHDVEFSKLLIEKGILSSKEDEKQKLIEKRYQRNATCFQTDELGLAICPTLACNFRCKYCFEQSQSDSLVMNDETIDKLIEFINKHDKARKLSVNWYGGEPTLVFEVIIKLSERFLDLDITYDNAALVTNGYLLDREKIDKLNDLRITNIQITLDGDAETHDNRRTLRNGGNTFDKILENVDALMTSKYKGSCDIRVNIDKYNSHEYQSIRNELIERFKGTKLYVYPGHVNIRRDHSYGHNCALSIAEWGDFIIKLYHEHGLVPKGGFFPSSNTNNSCIANNYYGYVIGPNGELYKCWEDVGKEEMVIGNIHSNDPIKKPELLALYSVGTDPFDDKNCHDCHMLPICGGGCVNKRLRKHYMNENGVEFCSPYKERLVGYLEAFYDTYRSREICNNILNGPKTNVMAKGYRLIEPYENNECKQKK